MTTSAHTLTVAGLKVSVVRKDIKNLHLGVYPPNGRVRVAVPPTGSDAAVRAEAKRIWLNRELVKKPPECLEYIVVHELPHPMPCSVAKYLVSGTHACRVWLV